MDIPEEAIPPLSDYQCGVCLEILIEPVTLPCDHSLCKECFLSRVKRSNLCCPFCRFWVSSWARYHMRRKSLVNTELWEKIKRHYPTECHLRQSCPQSEGTSDNLQLVRHLSDPGESRREYEEEMQKIEEDRNKASEEYIQKLLAEDALEEKRQAEKMERKRKRQLKTDEALAKKISLEMNYSWGGSDLASPMTSREYDPGTARSKKKEQKKQTTTGDIPECLSPKSDNQPVSVSKVAQEGQKSCTEETVSSGIKSTAWQDTEMEEDLPTLPSQICLEIQEQAAQSSIESPVPQSCGSGPGLYPEIKIKMTPDEHGKEVCVIIPEEPKPRASCSTEAAIKPRGKIRSKCIISDMTQIVGADIEPYPLISKGISKRKQQKTLFETDRDPCFSAKKGKMSPKASLEQEETEVTKPVKPLELDYVLFQRKMQEESDRTFALKLQEEIDKEMREAAGLKGSPYEYILSATSSAPDRSRTKRKNSKGNNSKTQTDKKRSKTPRGSKN